MKKSTTSKTHTVISIIIPTYNRSKELTRAIESVLSQTYQNFEILVVDDGSEEDLRIVCDSFNDNRIRFYRNEQHANANVARNRGIKEAKGEYIAMLDSDDEYMPHHLQRRIEKIKEWKCDGIFGSAYINDGETKRLKLSRPINQGELMINYLLSDGFAQTTSHFYNAECAKEIMWDESLFRHQDYDFSVRFAEKYEFKSDYEPSTLINWKKKNLNKLSFEQINSALSFMLCQEKHIKIPHLLKYYSNLYKLAKEKGYKDIEKISNQKIKQNIKHVSLSTYFTIYLNNTNWGKSILHRTRYLLKVLFA